MANENNISVEVSLTVHGNPHYVWFVKSLKDGTRDKTSNDYVRFIIDDHDYKKRFPNLVAHKWFLLDDIDLDTNTSENPSQEDKYIGMKGESDEGTVTSVILPNTVVWKDVESESSEPTTPGYYGCIYVTPSSVDTYDKIIDDEVDENKNTYLYRINVYSNNQHKTYIVDLLSLGSEKEHTLKDVIIACHEVDKTAHSNDISIFVSDKSSNSLISKLLWKYNDEINYIKMNGIVSVKPYSNRIKFYGTPIVFDEEHYFCKEDKLISDTQNSVEEVIDYIYNLFNQRGL